MIQLQYHNERVLDGQAVTWPYLAGSHPIAFFGLQLALFRAITSPRWGNRLRCLETRVRRKRMASENIYILDCIKVMSIVYRVMRRPLRVLLHG